ncbi:hypothetical protein A0H81_12987 [Grifola frondosa]|uniref:Uncharacterized protein n=1 Tax=Grifola frondosa TaxID=5627 RepID=A0A1C7LR21_GRIFR|nr:hypothetical protein A0H81_12987 [Grifola frondosa]
MAFQPPKAVTTPQIVGYNRTSDSMCCEVRTCGRLPKTDTCSYICLTDNAPSSREEFLRLHLSARDIMDPFAHGGSLQPLQDGAEHECIEGDDEVFRVNFSADWTVFRLQFCAFGVSGLYMLLMYLFIST